MGIIEYIIWFFMRTLTISIKFWYISAPALFLVTLAIFLQHRKIHPKTKRSD